MIVLVSLAQASSARFLASGGDTPPSSVDPTTGHGPEWGKAAPIGLLVIVLLCVGVYFLVKSLNRNLRKVPESFEAVPVSVGAAAGGDQEDSAAGTDSTPTGPNADSGPPNSSQ